MVYEIEIKAFRNFRVYLTYRSWSPLADPWKDDGSSKLAATNGDWDFHVNTKLNYGVIDMDDGSYADVANLHQINFNGNSMNMCYADKGFAWVKYAGSKTQQMSSWECVGIR